MSVHNRWRRRGPALFLVLLLAGALPWASAQQRTALLRNGGFEGGSSDGHGGGVPGWAPFDSGYDPDHQVHRNGYQSIRCDSLSPTARRGAQTRLELNQPRPIPVLITGWSRAERVGGVRDGDYSLYVDLEYRDGTPLWGQIAPFRVGTHNWERRQLLVVPTKPIRTLTVYALFRNHVGTVWFDDFYAREIAGNGIFDSQPLSPLPSRPPSSSALSVTGRDGLTLKFSVQGDITQVLAGGTEVSSAAAGGFFVRDAATNDPPIPIRDTAERYHGNGITVGGAAAAQRLRFLATVQPEGDALTVDGEIADTTGADRAVTVYLVLPVNADGWLWGNDIRHAERIQPGREYSNQVRVNVGATGGLSLYPFACVSSAQRGVGIANQMDWPGVYRLFYNGTTRQFVLAWDFALTGKNAAWPHNAHFRCRLFALPPGQAAWGFRAAAQRFYRLNAPNFDRRTTADGIWIPFTDPGKVETPEDFGFAFHEGDNSVKSDDAMGILSFRYTEPMTYWLPMPKELPRTYENALGLIQRNAAQDGSPTPGAQRPTPEARDFARAVLNSGTQDEDGRFTLQFRNEPWTDGAVFVLDPNPELPSALDRPTKASLSYSFATAAERYGAEAKKTRGDLDGEYLDSLEGWADTPDYRLTNLRHSPYPLPFDTDTRRPVLPQWYSTHTFAAFLRNDLHNRGKLLMANTTPVRFSVYAPLMDVMGIEVNWLDSNGGWQPDGDEVFNLRRTMSARKPYCLLMNTDFNKFTTEFVERYFQRSLFYGVFPSMFSVNAADSPYWENPKWVNRDRALFKKYIPVIKRLSAAGWEPITDARSANAAVFVERFGPRLFTVLNGSRQPRTTTLSIDLRALGLSASGLRVTNVLTGAQLPASLNGATLTVPLILNPEEAQALALR
jgi:hypothetical protein